MGIEQYRDRVAARVKQAIAQSGVDLAAVSSGQQDRLVGSITDSLLFEIDAIVGDGHEAAANLAATPPPTSTQATPPHPSSDETEHIVWEGRPFLSVGVRYVVTRPRAGALGGHYSA